MTLKRGPLTAGLLVGAAGLVLMTAFSTTDPFVLQAQLGIGGLAVLIGLYFVLVVSWRKPPVNLQNPPGIRTLIRREASGRFLRTFATGAAIALVVGALFATNLLTSGAAYSVNQVRNRLGADLVVLPQGSRLYLTEFSPGGCGALDKVYLIAADPQSNFMLKSWLPANVTQPLTGTGAVVGFNVPAFYLLQDQGKFYGTQLALQARLPATGTFIDHVIFISFSTADAMLAWQTTNTTASSTQSAGKGYNYWLPPLSFQPGQASAFFVKLEDGTSATAAATRVQSSISNVHAFTLDSVVKSASIRYSGLLSTFSISGNLVWLGALFLVSAVTYLGVNERKGEIGLMRAVGAPRRFVARLIIAQTIALTTISGLLGVVVAWVVFSWFSTSIVMTVGLPFSVPPPLQLAELLALSTALSALTGTLASLWPARVATRTEPYEAARLIAR
ncbi:MAG: ABC transporter permease [Thaumarchaeota archaeon]|nr:MAG: ABC transporter permease [Nitrososphaerota archaeon]